MWFAFLVVLLGSVAMVLLGWFALQGALPRQRWAGIRTRYAMANDEQWKAVHRFGAPFLIFGGVAGIAATAAALPFSLAGALPTGFSAAVIAAVALIIGASALMAWIFGERSARATAGR